ncbi:MAG: response regulator [Janthinobacterium lividum]
MNILIAEDDPVSALALRILLTKLGHTVQAATNGVEAWQMIQERPVPIAILDWMMPKMDGLELCRRIKNSSGHAYTCVMMLTAKQSREDRLTALHAGADVFLTKPLDRECLIARLQVAERILHLEAALT